MCWEVCGWLLEFYVLATSKLLSRSILTCDSVHHWEHASPMTKYPSQSHYPDSELTLSARLGSINFISHWFDSTGNGNPNFLPHARPTLYRFCHRAWWEVCVCVHIGKCVHMCAPGGRCGQVLPGMIVTRWQVCASPVRCVHH